MPAKPTTEQDRAGRPLTITEQARRAQFVTVTIDLIARHGYGGTSLARIAEAAGVSKAAVLYHFPTKNAVVQAAYATVIESLVAHVAGAVEALSGAAAIEAHIRSLIGYLDAHPEHARVIIEAIGGVNAVTDHPHTPSRQQTMADLVEAAKAAGHYRHDLDPVTTSIMINGAVDAIVFQHLNDPEFDPNRAADQLIDLLSRGLRARA